MPTKSPLVVLGKKLLPLPKFVGPVNPVYPGTFTFDCPIFIVPELALSPVAGETMISKVSPVRLMAPVPVATTLDPTCSSVTM